MEELRWRGREEWEEAGEGRERRGTEKERMINDIY